ncbi:MAG: patatin [Candidatus Eremiobacteraeota bacterium]|nr:patatin [Candidatus Eremiobacteraeota bacterium]
MAIEIAAAPGTQPRRALVLAGGGMRVAYQAGAIRALWERGYRFSHVDGSSGGIMNTGMLLSGIDPVEMGRRWATLDVKNFSTFWPARRLLRPFDLPALGTADGIVEKVFPHLGIDVGRINRQREVEGTFNVANFSRKTLEAIPHDVVRPEHLVAGLSLAIFLPAVEIDGEAYTDAVWMRDANLMEAVRRGADEIWVVWCIGNGTRWHDGAFHQYVHMIEMSANAGLFDQLERINELNERIAAGERPGGRTQPVRVHVLRPQRPIPLDPDFFLGRVTGATLVDMGYADASQYLDAVPPEGTPLTPAATAMTDNLPGIAFREVMHGYFTLGENDPVIGEKRGRAAGSSIVLHAAITIHDLARFIGDPTHRGSLDGHLDVTGFGESLPTTRGVFNLFSPSNDASTKLMVYEAGFRHGGRDYYMAGKKLVKHHTVLKLWPDTTTLYIVLHEGRDASGPVAGAGVLHLNVMDLVRLLVGMHAIDTDAEHTTPDVTFEFLRFFLGELWATYIRRALERTAPG